MPGGIIHEVSEDVLKLAGRASEPGREGRWVALCCGERFKGQGSRLWCVLWGQSFFILNFAGTLTHSIPV
jgi:hypothetical protein